MATLDQNNNMPNGYKSTPAQSGNDAVSAKDRMLILTIVIVLLVVAAIAIVGFLCIKQGPDTVQGQADASEIRISGKLPGRVAQLFVEEGAHVKEGDTLVRIHSTLVDARLGQAEAMESAANAANAKVDAGTRTQIINAAYDLWQQAKAASEITRKTYQRMQNLFEKGVISEQKRDEAKPHTMPPLPANMQQKASMSLPSREHRGKTRRLHVPWSTWRRVASTR